MRDTTTSSAPRRKRAQPRTVRQGDTLPTLSPKAVPRHAQAEATQAAQGEWRQKTEQPMHRFLHANRASLGSLAVFLIMLLEAAIRRRPGVANPWGEGATTLEWTLSSPPPHHQFNELPVVKADNH